MKDSPPTSGTMRTLLIVLFFSLFTISSFSKADVSASVDREYAYEGETITLSVKASNVSGSAQPDFSPLAKDFELFGTSQSSSISIINGNRSDSQTWSIRLRPKKLGQIDIPSIQVGKHSTLPLTVDVKPIPVQTGVQQNQSIFVTLEVDSQAQQFFVQQHIPVVARLYYLNEVNQGMITDPQPENATVERLGEDRKFSAPYNGKTYKVFERRYSVLPEKSGELTIPAISFRGYLKKKQQKQQPGQRYDPFSQFFDRSTFTATSTPVSVRSEPLNLDIASQPDQYDGKQWQPAESLELSDSWTSQPPTFKVGEPVSRTITLTAKGLLASQVQPPELPDASAFRRYAEPAETETRTDGQTVYAINRRTFTYIPTVEGMQEIPAIEVKWWDVINNQQANTVLPAWTVQVATDTNQHANQSSQPTDSEPKAKINKAAPSDNSVTAQTGIKPSNSPDKASTDTDESSATLNFSSVVEMIKHNYYWLAGFVLLVIILWLLSNRRSSGNSDVSDNAIPEPQTSTNLTDTLQENQAIESLNRACQANDIHAIAKALLHLAEVTWPESPPRSLGALAEKVSDGKQALLELDRVLYAKPDSQWDAAEIRRHFAKGFARNKTNSKQESLLKPLYPE